MSFTISSFINALGWTLIHSLWQGAILFLLLKLVLLYMRDSPARVRYGLSCFALAGIFIFFLFTFYYQWERISAFAQITSIAGNTATTETVPYGEIFSPAPLKDHLTTNWLLMLVGLYATGLFFFIGKVIRDIYVMRAIKNTGKKPVDRAWERYLARLAQAWKIPQNVGLYLSRKVDVPVVIGYFKPVIYLPFSLMNHLPPEQIETILLHELAHIKRADFLVNMLQTLVETLLFFNPFVWVVSNTMRKERELACDELVIAEKEPGIYAESLLALEENRINKGKLILAATHEKQQLLYRIKKIMEMKTKKFNIAQKLLVLLFIVITAFSISWLTPGKKEHTLPANKKQEVDKPLLPVLKDTLPPPAPTPPPSAPAAPASPANLQNKPPSPPAPPHPPVAADSIPAMPDSILSGITTGIQQYFNSEDWKNYIRSIKAYTSSLKQYYKSKDSMRYAFAINKPDTDSILSRVRGKVARLIHKDTAIMTVTNSKKNINTNRLINKLNEDGLLKNRDNYKIRLNDRGLFINGQKQPDAYYKKYRALIGENTKIKIKKSKGAFSSSINTSD